MFDNLAKALGWSALLHLLVIALLWYTHQPIKVVAQPKAIEAFVYQPKPVPPKPPVTKPAEVAPEAPVKPDPKPTPTAVKTEPVIAPEKLIAARPTSEKPADEPTNKAIDNNSTPTDATHVTNPTQEPHAMTLAERSLAIATRRNNDISSEALAASRLRPDLRDRPATTSKVQLKPEHAAANVLMQLSDGSFIEKVGDYCYQAKPGADLRADISSMKPVPCGEDKNAAMYDRIMSKVGQDR